MRREKTVNVFIRETPFQADTALLWVDVLSVTIVTQQIFDGVSIGGVLEWIAEKGIVTSADCLLSSCCDEPVDDPKRMPELSWDCDRRRRSGRRDCSWRAF
jgi:hypothetical protein